MNLLVKRNSIILAISLMLCAAVPAWAGQDAPLGRYFFSGDGRITLYSEINEESFSGVYRSGPGAYDRETLCRISKVFGTSCDPSRMGLSLRLLEFIDYLEDRFNRGAQITIISGYRSPEYNTSLRKEGELAVKASMHLYGMAADLRIQDVQGETVWNYVKGLGFGGVGYYHGSAVHVDVGPARYWDETSTGVDTGISEGNKLIGIMTDYDIYRPGMTITLQFVRMTALPIRVASEFSLVRQSSQKEPEEPRVFMPAFSPAQAGNCAVFKNIDEMDNIEWVLPADLQPGRYRVLARFCNGAWPLMPRQVQTPEFEVTFFP